MSTIPVNTMTDYCKNIQQTSMKKITV